MENLVWQAAAWVGSLIVGIGIVAKFLEKYSPKIRQALRVTDETLDIINAILDASDDKHISPEELKVIATQISELQEVLKKGDI